MKNFDSDEERYFAACVLDSLIYRSEEQTTSLVVHLFLRPLVDLTRLDPTPLGQIDDWLDRLRGSSDPGIRLVAAVKQRDEPHKSAHLVSRLMKRQLAVNSRWLAKPWELDQHIKRGAQVLVFIDDFLGTGEQFEELLTVERLDWLFGHAYVVYAPFAAHKEGITNLKRKFPLLHVVGAEVLDERHAPFKSEARCFDDGVNNAAGAEAFYFDLLAKKGIPLNGVDRLGFGGLGLAYVFEHAVPDNNLPILWHQGNSDWMPLFDR